MENTEQAEQVTPETPVDSEASSYERALEALEQNVVEGIDAEEAPAEPEVPVAPPVEEKPQETERDKLLSQQFAVNARLERQLRELSQELKSTKESGKPEIDPELQRLIELKEEAKFDPMAWLEAAGLDYDMLTEYQINGGRPRESKDVVNLKKTIEKMEQERQQEKEERTKREQEQATQSELNEIKAQILGEKENFPVISAFNNQYELVKDVQLEAQKDGVELSVTDAAAKVEAYLLNQVRTEFETLSQIPQVRNMAQELLAKFQSSGDNSKTESAVLRSEQAPQSHEAETKRLTNSMNQMAGTEPNRELSDEERRAKAIAMLDI